jgi:cobalamin biosynthesis protein CobT
MARGWESKSVESQMESAETPFRSSFDEQLPAEELELLRKKESLKLSCTRVQRDLEASHNPRYRSMMEKALVDLNAELSRLEHRRVRAVMA